MPHLIFTTEDNLVNRFFYHLGHMKKFNTCRVTKLDLEKKNNLNIVNFNTFCVYHSDNSGSKFKLNSLKNTHLHFLHCGILSFFD